MSTSPPHKQASLRIHSLNSFNQNSMNVPKILSFRVLFSPVACFRIYGGCCYNFSCSCFAPVYTGINADCKIGVYAYHWKHKRCTIKMWHEYLSSWLESSSRGWWTIIFHRLVRCACDEYHWVAGRTLYKPYFSIIFTFLPEESGVNTEFSKMAGIFLNLFDFRKEFLSLSAYLVPLDGTVANKTRSALKPFQMNIKIYLSKYIQSKLCIEDKSLDVFCYIINFLCWMERSLKEFLCGACGKRS